MFYRFHDCLGIKNNLILEQDKKQQMWRPLLAECIGTAIFFGAIFALTMKSESKTPIGITAFGIGLALCVSIYFANLLGGPGHHNGSLSIAMWLANRISSMKMLQYIGAQLVGVLLVVAYVKLAPKE